MDVHNFVGLKARDMVIRYGYQHSRELNQPLIPDGYGEVHFMREIKT
jgi:hypothetical protein